MIWRASWKHRAIVAENRNRDLQTMCERRERAAQAAEDAANDAERRAEALYCRAVTAEEREEAQRKRAEVAERDAEIWAGHAEYWANRAERAEQGQTRAAAELAAEKMRRDYERESTGEPVGDAETAGKVRYQVIYNARPGLPANRRVVTIHAPHIMAADKIAELGRRHGEVVFSVEPWSAHGGTA